MRFDCLGKITGIEEDKFLVIKLGFTSVIQLKMIEEAIKNDKPLKFSFNSNFRKPKTYKQLRRYFSMLQMIIRSVNEVPTAENIDLLDRHLKNTIFPKERDPYGSTGEMLPKLKRNMTSEEMNNIMHTIELTYTDIDFDRRRIDV